MTTALLLSGGTGTRVGGDTPKQYILISGKPVFIYSLEKLEQVPEISRVILTAEPRWYPFIRAWIARAGLRRPYSLAPAGDCRQQSVRSGLEAMKALGAKENDIVIIHEAARPCCPPQLLQNCILTLAECDGVMPVLPMKDTVYVSADGKSVSGLLDRSVLFAGQSPEAYRFGRYYAAHRNLSDDELRAVRGSSELAFKNGIEVHMIPGSEENYKITTPADIEKFRRQTEASCHD